MLHRRSWEWEWTAAFFHSLCLKPISAILYTVVFVFFCTLLAPHFPVYINSVIMWGFIWLIKASSFWAISQRTWIKLPYLCTGATVGSTKACFPLCRLWKEKKSFTWGCFAEMILREKMKLFVLKVWIKGFIDEWCIFSTGEYFGLIHAFCTILAKVYTLY